MSDITLINTVFPSEVKVPPQGSLYLAAALEEAGLEAELRDYQQCTRPDHPHRLEDGRQPWHPESLARFAEGGAEVVGFSCMSYALPLIIETVKILKRREPDRFVVLGGIGPSGVAEPLLEHCPEIDAVVIGEGERTVVDLLRTMRNGGSGCSSGNGSPAASLADVQGLVYRDGDRVRRTAPRPRIPSLAELPMPAYHRVSLDHYRLVDSQFARGCPYPCSFCDIAPYWDRTTTKRPIEHYLDELEILVDEHGARDVFIVDDTFVLSRKTILHFCDEIVRRGLEFQWGCYARVDLMDDELMERMAAAGCQKIFYGLESGSDRVLQEISKNITAEEIRDTVQRSLEHFPFITASFLWGAPTETLEDLQDTAFLLIYLASLGACPQLNLLLPYSYSTLYKQYQDRILFDPEFSSQLLFYETEPEWTHGMIEERPDLFSCFYRLPTPQFEEKWRFLHDVGLDPHALQRAYDHPIPVPMELVDGSGETREVRVSGAESHPEATAGPAHD